MPLLNINNGMNPDTLRCKQTLQNKHKIIWLRVPGQHRVR